MLYDNFAIMVSLDFSDTFDFVNIELLIKRLKLIGIPRDLVNRIRIWLRSRKFYADINGSCSLVYYSGTSTVQGSILGPLLYAIFV
jgi:hypothetical protein